jgi:hypothetical protein
LTCRANQWYITIIAQSGSDLAAFALGATHNHMIPA